MNYPNSSNKERIHQDTDRKTVFERIKKGIQSALKNSNKAAILAAYILIAIIGWFWLQPDGETAFAAFGIGLHKLSYIPAVVIGLLCLFYVYGRPKGAQAVRDSLTRAGVVNHAGEAPTLTDRQQDPDNPKVEICILDANGVSVSELEDHRAEVESALNVHIGQIGQGADKGQIRFSCVAGDKSLPDRIEWHNEYLNQQNFMLVLGESILGKVYLNLAEMPHMLIGGATSSGKTILFKSLLAQCEKKGANIIVADLKGGVDFPVIWYSKGLMLLDELAIVNTLDHLVWQIDDRKKLFKEAGASGIDNYNAITGENLSRFVFACDEVAELFLYSSRDKEQKALFEKIERNMSYIARQGRAFGIHLMLSTQRPDANIIPPQIRSNLTTRICGRADKILAQIIMDSTEAAEQVPLDTAGRFYTNIGNGTLFQAYWFSEETFWREGEFYNE